MKITSKKQLDERIEELQSIQREIQELSAIADDIKDSIKKYMKDKEEIVTKNHTVKWTIYSSKRFDQNRFKEAHQNLFESYLTESVSRRFSIS